MNFDFVCTKDWILGDVPHQLWEATTADGQTGNVLFTRFLHNKLLFYANNFFRCYLSYLSADFITRAFTIVGLVLFIIGLYQAIHRRNWFILTLVLLGPLFPLFNFPRDNYSQGLAIYGVLGLVMVYGAKELLGKVKNLLYAL